MATSGRTGDVICPFYRLHKDLSITCESPIPDAACTRTTFRSQEEFNFHLMNYCCHKDYKKCEIFVAINEKYE